MKIFISTGEVSGDLQGSLLIEALKRQATAAGRELEITALGGSRMAKAGATLLGDTTGIGAVGILESVPYIWPTLQLQERAKQYLRSQPPAVVVLIDYMGPNISIGRYIRQHLPEVPIIWYIAPQVWVWSPPWGDAEKIVAIASRVLAIFPEEARYFESKGAQVTWVGHPLVERMQAAPSREAARVALGIEPQQRAIALLPASRQQEIKYMMPVIFEAAERIQRQLPNVRFWIPLSREAYRRPIEQAVADYGLQATVYPSQPHLAQEKLKEDRTLEILAAADLAITKSGTVNLELALLNVPQLVIYRVNPFTFWLARKLLKFSIPFMSPVNLVQMKSIVPEWLQEQATATNIAAGAMEFLLNPEQQQQTLIDYQVMREALGDAGACNRAAQVILRAIEQNQ